MGDIIWNGVSFRDIGIIINSLPPIVRAEENVDFLESKNRNGYLTVDYGTHSAITKTATCTLTDTTDIDYICNWLQGNGKVIFSNQSDRYYEARIKNSIPFEEIFASGYREFLIQFYCQPFAKDIDDLTLNITESGSSFFSTNFTESEPVLTIYGTGDISITLNCNTFNLIGIDEYITINTELLECYKDSELLNTKMSGDFPLIMNGENTISWTGTVTNIEIKMNKRYL